MSFDDSFSPLHIRKSKGVTPLNTPLQIKRDVAAKLSLTNRVKYKDEKSAACTPVSNSVEKPKTPVITANFLFGSCKKNRPSVEKMKNYEEHLLADSSNEGFNFSLQSIEDNSSQEVVQESLEEFSLIRRWLQNASSSESEVELINSSGEVSKSNTYSDSPSTIAERLERLDLKAGQEKDKSMNDTIVLSSDDDEPNFEAFLISVRNEKKVNKSIENHGNRRKDTYDSSFIDDSSIIEDSFDSPEATKLLQQRLLERDIQQRKQCSLEKDVGKNISNSHNVLTPCIKGQLPIANKIDTGVKQKELHCTKEVNEVSKKSAITSSVKNDLATSLKSLSISDPKDRKTPRKVNKQKLEVENLKCIGFHEQSSFLASLSESCAKEKLHPEAVLYVTNYRKKRDELTQRLFILFNERVFNSELPSDFSVTWNKRLTRTAGFCRHFSKRENGKIVKLESKIELSEKVVDTAARLRDTLIHEMCHAATWLIDNCRGGHGPRWRRWANRARIVFPELPPITICHNYEITYKFYYNCTTCSYSLGRHSKSIDTDTHVCPYCRNKLELGKEPKAKCKENVEPTTKAPAQPATPRTPNAFALFVKENYAEIRASRSDLSHGDVMKLLSSLFADAKKSKT